MLINYFNLLKKIVFNIQQNLFKNKQMFKIMIKASMKINSLEVLIIVFNKINISSTKIYNKINKIKTKINL
jgi:hypothetical protein